MKNKYFEVNVAKKIQELFINRDYGYAQQIENENKYVVIKKRLSLSDILQHLRGEKTIGSFQINPSNNKVKWICFDFDGILSEEFEKSKKLINELHSRGLNPLLEFSGRRGYHVWLLIDPVDSVVAKTFGRNVGCKFKPHEIFPKQDEIKDDEFGGQVKLPLVIHRVSKNWSYFFNYNFERLSRKESKKLLLNNSERDEIKIKNLDFFIEN